MALIADAEVQVRSGGYACRAHIADDLTLSYGSACLNRIIGHMHVDGVVSVAVVNEYIVTGGHVVTGKGHRSGSGGIYWGSLRCAQINALVENGIIL